MRLKNWSLLLSILGMFVAFTGYIKDNSPMVWIGATLAIASLFISDKDEE